MEMKSTPLTKLMTAAMLITDKQGGEQAWDGVKKEPMYNKDNMVFWAHIFFQWDDIENGKTNYEGELSPKVGNLPHSAIEEIILSLYRNNKS